MSVPLVDCVVPQWRCSKVDPCGFFSVEELISPGYTTYTGAIWGARLGRLSQAQADHAVKAREQLRATLLKILEYGA